MGAVGAGYYTDSNHYLCDMAGERWQMRLLKHIVPIVTISVVTIFLILLFDRRQAVETLTIRFVSAPVVAGKPVMVQWTVIERRHGCAGKVYPIWIDSSGTVFDAKVDIVPFRDVKGDDPQTFRRPRIVPIGLMPGDATFAPWAERWCNPVQEWLWPMRDELPKVKFTVSAPP